MEQIAVIKFTVPSALVERIKSFESQIPGSEFRLVGGCIRDLILERTPKDWDIITNALPEQLVAAGFENVGKSFPVFLYQDEKFGQLEIACCRTERKIGTGHNAFEVKVCQSFEEDAIRRDLTVNACSWHHSTPDSIYIYNSTTATDFKTGTLRAMSPAFAEDPLRVFRVARFSAQLSSDTNGCQWTPDNKTLSMMMSLEDELKTLPPDRIRAEFESAMFKAEDFEERNSFFITLHASNSLSYWFSELDYRYPINILRDLDSPYKKEILYLSIAYAISTKIGGNLDIKKDIKSFCSKLNIGLEFEMETFAMLATDIPNQFGWGTIKTNEEIFTICRRLQRGKIPAEVYFDSVRAICGKLAFSDDAMIYFDAVRLAYLALKDMKFSATDTPTQIREAQVACVAEFIEIFVDTRKHTRG